MNMYMKFTTVYLILLGLMCSSFYHKTLTKRNYVKNDFLFTYGFQLVFFALEIYFSPFLPGLSYVCLHIALFFPCILFYRNPFVIKFTSYVMVYLALISAETIPGGILSIINIFFPERSLLPRDIMENEDFYPALIYYIMALTLMIIVYKVLIDILQKNYLLLNFKTLLMLSVPFALSFFMENLLYISTGLKQYIVASVIFWFLFVIYVPIFIIGLNRLKEHEILQSQYQSQKKILEQQISYFQSINENDQKNRKWNHDINNHFIAISYLLEEQRYEEASKYIDLLFTTHKPT